jgi:predicted alpha/beta-fold hydrolase
MAEAAAPFRPRFPWWGGDLQTLRNTLMQDAPDPGPFTRLLLPLPDGDALACAWHEAPGPPVVLVHGLTGTEDSQHTRRSAAFFLARGNAVARLNLRGAGPSRATSRRSYHAGAGGDIAHALAALPRPPRYAVAVSLGGTQLFHALCHPALPRLAAAATIGAPVDLLATSRRMMAWRNGLYHRVILRGMQREAAALAGHLPQACLDAALRATSVYGFDDAYVAPLNGFAGADDYYARCSLAPVIQEIATPTLCLTAADDPWVPAATYDAVRWTGAVRKLVTPGGGHVGFHDARADGTWADRAVAEFFSRHPA